jgi:signal peptidase
MRMAAVALVVLGWGIWLRPEFIGGRVGYMIVGGRSMLPTLHGGDLVMVKRRSVYRVGDIVAYHIPDGVFRGRRIIHRIVGGDARGFVMQGDNNAEDDLWRPRPGDIDGKLWKRVPAAGLVVAVARAPGVLAALVGGLVFAFVLTWERRSPVRGSAGSDAQPDDRVG